MIASLHHLHSPASSAANKIRTDLGVTPVRPEPVLPRSVRSSSPHRERVSLERASSCNQSASTPVCANSARCAPLVTTAHSTRKSAYTKLTTLTLVAQFVIQLLEENRKDTTYSSFQLKEGRSESGQRLLWVYIILENKREVSLVQEVVETIDVRSLDVNLALSQKPGTCVCVFYTCTASLSVSLCIVCTVSAFVYAQNTYHRAH